MEHFTLPEILTAFGFGQDILIQNKNFPAMNFLGVNLYQPIRNCSANAFTLQKATRSRHRFCPAIMVVFWRRRHLTLSVAPMRQKQ